MWDISDGLGISALPTRATLTLFKALGFTDLINVSGSATCQLYSVADLSGLAFADFPFPDALSTASAASEIVAQLGDAGLAELKDAVVRTAVCLREQRRVIVFCHLGVGRSPAVATIALMLARQYSLDEAVRRVVKLRPQAALGPATAAFAQSIHDELAARS